MEFKIFKGVFIKNKLSEWVSFIALAAFHVSSDTIVNPLFKQYYDVFFILAGGIFVRWGRKDCPANNTELIYSGKHLDCICLIRGAENAHRCVAKCLK